LDKRSIRRTIAKTKVSNLFIDQARLAKYRLKKEYAMENYSFDK
jgi:hypothetical protein